MALSGEAKREYMRRYRTAYMRGYRAGERRRRDPVETWPVSVETPAKSVETLRRDPKTTAGNVETPCRDPSPTKATAVSAPKMGVTDDLRAKMRAIETGQVSQSSVAEPAEPPIYDAAVHGPGDVVRMRQGRGYVVTTVQAVDAEGNVIPAY